MDGFSVRSADTFGASEGLPAYLDVVGEVPMGQAPAIELVSGQAARAYTGGMLAGGADAVVMVEQTQAVDETTIEVLRPVAPGEHVIQAGEDVRVGDRVIPAGHVIRPQDIGGLLGVGITEVTVSRRPVVSIVSTGDELVAPEATPGPGQVRDINTGGAGGARGSGRRRSSADSGGRRRLRGAAGRGGPGSGARRRARFSRAGSSVSSRDMTADVFRSLGEPGVLGSTGSRTSPASPP